MTALQWIHVASTASFLAIAAYVLWRAPRLQRSAGVAAIAVCFAWWSACLFLAHNPDVSRVQAVSGYDLGAIAWASFASLALMFALAFAGKRELLARRAVKAALIVPPLIVMVEQWRGALAANYLHESWGWAFQWSASPGTVLFYAYYATYTTAAFAIVFLAGRRSGDRLVKRQAAIIGYTAMVPFVCSTATDVVLPWLDIHTIPNIAPTFLVVWTIGIAIATVRYRLFEITPETAADDILTAMSDGLLLIDRDGRVVACNPAANRLLANGADSRGVQLSVVLAKAAGPHPLEASEIDVAARTLSVSRSVVRDIDGVAIGSIYLFRDITDRKRAEQELAVAHAELEVRVLERTRELDNAYHELQRMVRALGGLHAAVDAIHKANSARELAAGVVRTLATAPELGLGCRIVLDGETFVSDGFTATQTPIQIAIAASGKPRGSLEVHGSELRDAERDVIARVGPEIGQALEGLALRHALAQADRLASIGVLAAGVAHEINNPLTYLTLGLYDIQDELEGQGETLRDRVKESLHGCERITKIVRELGSFARDGDEVRVVAVGEAIDAAVAMATHQIRHRARLSVRHDAVGAVRADLGRLTQVFLNLLVNAAQAIPDGNADAHLIEVDSGDAAEHVVVVVRDSGRGISADDLPHVFEPFFTTATAGEGSGLGLSICQKIVRSIGGELTVDSVLGEGARFTVRLPRVTDAPAIARTPSRPLAEGTAAPGAKILIVDDDAPVAAALARILENHEVTIVESGATARRLLETGTAFDLVMCDVMMPDMNGPELHAWVVEHRPDLAQQMLFMTGGAFTAETDAFFEEHRHEIVAKPFKPDVIARLVSELLPRRTG